MKPAAFRFDALLDVYQTQEDSIRGEISTLEGERKGVQRRIDDLYRDCEEATEPSRREDVVTSSRRSSGMSKDCGTGSNSPKAVSRTC